jgi:hypothetical protein
MDGSGTAKKGRKSLVNANKTRTKKLRPARDFPNFALSTIQLLRLGDWAYFILFYFLNLSLVKHLCTKLKVLFLLSSSLILVVLFYSYYPLYIFWVRGPK